MNEAKQSVEKHVQVIARPRPLNENEKSQNLQSCFSVYESRREIVVNCKTTSTRFFSFDQVFSPTTKQQDLYKSVVSPIIDEVLKGYSCTIFAYGQTGSGKTHTMLGKFNLDKSLKDSAVHMTLLDVDAGIMPRAIQQLFQGLNRQHCDFTVKITYLELYNEELLDLLADTSVEPEKIKIYEDKDHKGTNMIVGANEITVENPHEAYKALVKGSLRRATAETLMNATSSRSHSIFTMTATMKEQNGDIKFGKIHLVDLAGSENIQRSGASDKRAREAGTINQSLLTLGRVITALINNEKHVSYRDSKLTRILQDSLCGKTITSIIITLSPANEFETLSTLEYGQRARSIRIRPEPNQLSTKDVAKEYAEEIRRLRKELEAKREADGIPYTQYITVKNQLITLQAVVDSKDVTIDSISQQLEQYKIENETFRRQLSTTQTELRSQTEEKNETQALLRYRYDELIYATDKALTHRDQALKCMQFLRDNRTKDSTTLEQYTSNCRLIIENIQLQMTQLNDSIKGTFTNFVGSIDNVLNLFLIVRSRLDDFNTNIRSVLTSAFTQFHSTHTDLNNFFLQLQNDIKEEIKSTIIKNNNDSTSDKMICEQSLMKVNTYFQTIKSSFEKPHQTLWTSLYNYMTNRVQTTLAQMLAYDFRNIVETTRDSSSNVLSLDVDAIKTNWLNEYEVLFNETQADIEEMVVNIINSITKHHHNLQSSSKTQNAITERIEYLCTKYIQDNQELLSKKFNQIFVNIKTDYDTPCETLFHLIEEDMNKIIENLNIMRNEVDYSQSSVVVIKDQLSKQFQRFDVLNHNVKHEWKLMSQSIEKFENDLSLLPTLMSEPKSDFEICQEIKQRRLSVTDENKENVMNIAPVQLAPPILQNRHQNENPFF